ncbi:VOC family protein [Kineococcus sp. NBC_00420]|uniref:VOC family protein n=1 Tax=Kineococcus sp. NBC_00420 TaxID=2903564 RepID=UPI002E1DBEE5
MTLRTHPWPAGVPARADLATDDPGAAATFYGAVLGWTVVGHRPDGSPLLGVDGAVAAEAGPATTSGWTLSIATTDLDATVAAVTAAGGSVLSGPGDVDDAGRSAVVADPTGAVVGLWEAGTRIGASWVNAPGGLNWEDLRSSDPALSREFYAAVFGWTFRELFDGYAIAANVDAPHPIGGVGPLWGSAPGWLVYFGVPDVDAAVRAALAGGGEVVHAAHDSDFGRMAQVRDPWGAGFAVFTPLPGAPQPDR